MSPRLQFAIESVHAAGQATLAWFQTNAKVDLKADATPVTEADRCAERILRERIGARYPGEAILGEEEGLTGAGSLRWIIDPIDGTKSFISGVPTYACLLSLEEDGAPILGVAGFPGLGEIVAGEFGGGCLWNGRPARVSGQRTVVGSILSCGGPLSMTRHGRWDGFMALSEKAITSRTWSDAFGHALVATGRAAAMIDPVVSHWDISAMVLLVREAGGVCTRFDGGDPLEPKADGSYELVSSNGLIHEEVLAAFR